MILMAGIITQEFIPIIGGIHIIIGTIRVGTLAIGTAIIIGTVIQDIIIITEAMMALSIVNELFLGETAALSIENHAPHQAILNQSVVLRETETGLTAMRWY